MHSPVVGSFSNFLATFDQDLWQALILKRPFSVNSGTYNATTICSAVWIVMHVFQSSLTVHSSKMANDDMARKLSDFVALTTEISVKSSAKADETSCSPIKASLAV